MYTIYNEIKDLCDGRGIKPGKMCSDIGLSRSILTDLKTGRKKTISTPTAQKIADYFGVTVDRVLGNEGPEEQKENPAPTDGDGPARYKLLSEENKVKADEYIQLLLNSQS